jgi:uncharacterized protein
VLHLSEIYIYPVKSLAGIRVQKAFAGGHGLQYDRRWMITHDDYTFITQREIPSMSLVGTQIGNEGIIIFDRRNPSESITLPFDVTGERIEAIVWEDHVRAVHYNRLADEWISDLLKSSCRFIYMPDDAGRHVPEAYSVNNENVSFADAFPYLILGEASVNDLNSRLDDPVPMNRFRPNLVFSGGLPYEEDKWSEFTVDEAVFKVMKPCGRCIITTINQDTAEQGKEPLRTLASYRTMNNKVMFGMNVLALQHGSIQEGSVIYIK